MTVLTLTGGLALDLGSSNARIYRPGAGVVVNEPSLALLDRASRRVLAVGREAKTCLGRTPKGLEVVQPVQGGLITDFSTAKEMIRLFLSQAAEGRRLFRPRLTLTAPPGGGQAARRALIEAAEQAGGGEILLVEQTLAAALGLGLDLERPKLILNVGGGLAGGAVLAGGAAVFAETGRTAGEAATRAVARHLELVHGLEVGENTAERLKLALGGPEEIPPCWGRSLATGRPGRAAPSREGLREALLEVGLELAALVKRLLRQAPPEYVAAISLEGLYLTGGGGLLAGLASRLSLETGLATRRPAEPLTSVILGLGAA